MLHPHLVIGTMGPGLRLRATHAIGNRTACGDRGPGITMVGLGAASVNDEPVRILCKTCRLIAISRLNDWGKASAYQARHLFYRANKVHFAEDGSVEKQIANANRMLALSNRFFKTANMIES